MGLDCHTGEEIGKMKKTFDQLWSSMFIISKEMDGETVKGIPLFPKVVVKRLTEDQINRRIRKKYVKKGRKRIIASSDSEEESLPDLMTTPLLSDDSDLSEPESGNSVNETIIKEAASEPVRSDNVDHEVLKNIRDQGVASLVKSLNTPSSNSSAFDRKNFFHMFESQVKSTAAATGVEMKITDQTASSYAKDAPGKRDSLDFHSVPKLKPQTDENSSSVQNKNDQTISSLIQEGEKKLRKESGSPKFSSSIKSRKEAPSMPKKKLNVHEAESSPSKKGVKRKTPPRSAPMVTIPSDVLDNAKRQATERSTVIAEKKPKALQQVAEVKVEKKEPSLISLPLVSITQFEDERFSKSLTSLKFVEDVKYVGRKLNSVLSNLKKHKRDLERELEEEIKNLKKKYEEKMQKVDESIKDYQEIDYSIDDEIIVMRDSNTECNDDLKEKIKKLFPDSVVKEENSVTELLNPKACTIPKIPNTEASEESTSKKIPSPQKRTSKKIPSPEERTSKKIPSPEERTSKKIPSPEESITELLPSPEESASKELQTSIDESHVPQDKSTTIAKRTSLRNVRRVTGVPKQTKTRKQVASSTFIPLCDVGPSEKSSDHQTSTLNKPKSSDSNKVMTSNPTLKKLLASEKPNNRLRTPSFLRLVGNVRESTVDKNPREISDSLKAPAETIQYPPREDPPPYQVSKPFSIRTIPEANVQFFGGSAAKSVVTTDQAITGQSSIVEASQNQVVSSASPISSTVMTHMQNAMQSINSGSSVIHYKSPSVADVTISPTTQQSYSSSVTENSSTVSLKDKNRLTVNVSSPSSVANQPAMSVMGKVGTAHQHLPVKPIPEQQQHSSNIQKPQQLVMTTQAQSAANVQSSASLYYQSQQQRQNVTIQPLSSNKVNVIQKSSQLKQQSQPNQQLLQQQHHKLQQQQQEQKLQQQQQQQHKLQQQQEQKLQLQQQQQHKLQQQQELQQQQQQQQQKLQQQQQQKLQQQQQQQKLQQQQQKLQQQQQQQKLQQQPRKLQMQIQPNQQQNQMIAGGFQMHQQMSNVTQMVPLSSAGQIYLQPQQQQQAAVIPIQTSLTLTSQHHAQPILANQQQPISLVQSPQQPISLIQSPQQPISLIQSPQQPISLIQPPQQSINLVQTPQQSMNLVQSQFPIVVATNPPSYSRAITPNQMPTYQTEPQSQQIQYNQYQFPSTVTQQASPGPAPNKTVSLSVNQNRKLLSKSSSPTVPAARSSPQMIMPKISSTYSLASKGRTGMSTPPTETVFEISVDLSKETCFICGVQATILCCGQFVYCGSDCKNIDHERHKLECRKLN